jgi:hypothetical protein
MTECVAIICVKSVAADRRNERTAADVSPTVVLRSPKGMIERGAGNASSLILILWQSPAVTLPLADRSP